MAKPEPASALEPHSKNGSCISVPQHADDSAPQHITPFVSSSPVAVAAVKANLEKTHIASPARN